MFSWIDPATVFYGFMWFNTDIKKQEDLNNGDNEQLQEAMQCMLGEIIQN